MEAEIIYKYPKEVINGLEINNSAASILFPNGIKICYENFEENIKTVRNYITSFTNKVGQKLYAVTYHFYSKMRNIDFEIEYELTPIGYEFKKYLDEDDALEKKIDEESLKKKQFLKI